MLYSSFADKQLSLLGFGTMRFPLTQEGAVDVEQVERMTAYAMEKGVNYFDTAWPYHDGESERIIGRILKKYDRNTYYLANKYPGHQISSSYNPADIFEKQLEKCQVEYFDFYLLHNVYEKSIDTYMDPQWGILDYFKKQKQEGRIRHLGFSAHANPETLERFLEYAGEDMEFCQIQLNYLDWTLQDAGRKYEILTKWNIPVWVMEPLRGGRLAMMKEEEAKPLNTLRPEESLAAWSFRFLQDLPNVKMVLSGMSNEEQMQQNIETFSERKPLSVEEKQTLFLVAESLKGALPCTGCRYCCPDCPSKLDIPLLLSMYNEVKFAATMIAGMTVEALPEDKRPEACIACGKCTKICPQNIDIPKAMKDFDAIFKKMPSWAEICRQREAAQK